jgi:ERCC4-type nuclease
MSIVCDTREKNIERIQTLILDLPDVYLDRCPQFEFKCLGLNLGDYLIENEGSQICIERKSIGDFAATYTNLKDRLHKMRMEYDRVGLLLEGTYKVINGQVYLLEGSDFVPRMKYSTYSNFLTHQAELGTHIYYTMNFDESFYRLIEIHDYLPKLETPTTLKCKSPLEWLMMLPGIGKVAIQKMKADYASPLEAINNLPKKAKEMISKW